MKALLVISFFLLFGPFVVSGQEKIRINQAEEKKPEKIEVRPEEAKNVPAEEPEPKTIPDYSPVSWRFDLGGVLRSGYNPLGVGILIQAPIKVLNVFQGKMELGVIGGKGFFYGYHLGLGHYSSFGKLDVYGIFNYGSSAVKMREFNNKGLFQFWDYSADLGVKYQVSDWHNLNVLTEFCYSGKKPPHVRIGITLQ